MNSARVDAAAALGDALASRSTFRVQRAIASDARACQQAVALSAAVYAAQVSMPPAIVSGRHPQTVPAAPCARFTDSPTWAVAQLGSNPIGPPGLASDNRTTAP